MNVKVTSVSLPPELHSKFKKIAHIQQRKMNTVIKSLIESYVSENEGLLQRFESVFPEIK